MKKSLGTETLVLNTNIINSVVVCVNNIASNRTIHVSVV